MRHPVGDLEGLVVPNLPRGMPHRTLKCVLIQPPGFGLATIFWHSGRR